MISGRLALNRGHERTSRWMPNEGESVFPSNRQQEIYTIDHARFPLLPSPLPLSLSFDYDPASSSLLRLREAHLCDSIPWQNSGFSGGVSCVKATARSADFSLNNTILSFRRENLRVLVRTFSGQSTVEIPSPPDEADGLRYSHFLLVTKRYSPATSADNEHSVASKGGSFSGRVCV